MLLLGGDASITMIKSDVIVVYAALLSLALFFLLLLSSQRCVFTLDNNNNNNKENREFGTTTTSAVHLARVWYWIGVGKFVGDNKQNCARCRERLFMFKSQRSCQPILISLLGFRTCGAVDGVSLFVYFFLSKIPQQPCENQRAYISR